MFFGERSARPAVLLTALVLVMLVAINPVGAPALSFGATPSTVTVAAGGSVSTTMSISTSDPLNALGVSCISGLPAGGSCSTTQTFPVPVPNLGPPFTFPLTINTSPSTPPGTYTVTVQLTFTIGGGDIISPGFALSLGLSKTAAGGRIGPASISIQQLPLQASTNITLIIPGPIPEYPLGLPLLAVFMIVGYGLIRRRTKNPKKL